MINDEICKTFVQGVIQFSTAFSQNIPLFLMIRLQGVQNCTGRKRTHTRKREHITTYFPSTLTFCAFQMAVQDPVSFIKTTVCKRSDPKVYTIGNASILRPIHVRRYQNATQQYTERYPSEHQFARCGTICQTVLNLQQVKKYVVRFLKPTYFNYRIYNI